MVRLIRTLLCHSTFIFSFLTLSSSLSPSSPQQSTQHFFFSIDSISIMTHIYQKDGYSNKIKPFYQAVTFSFPTLVTLASPQTQHRYTHKITQKENTKTHNSPSPSFLISCLNIRPNQPSQTKTKLQTPNPSLSLKWVIKEPYFISIPSFLF